MDEICDDEGVRAAASRRMTYTIPEFAELLGVSRNRAYEAAREKQIPTIQIGRRLLVPKVAGDRLLRGEAA